MPFDYRIDPERKSRINQLGFNPQTLPLEYIKCCDLCGESVFRIISYVDRYGFDCCYQLCEGCGSIFQNPRPTKEGYEQFYAGVYRNLINAYRGPSGLNKTVTEDGGGYAKHVVRFLKPHINDITQAVDLGGSVGVVARAVEKEFSCRCLVVDPSPSEVEEARASGLEGEIGLAETWIPGERQYDLVLICRSIDHCLSITEVFEKVREALAPNGLLFLDFVDFEFLAKTREFRDYLKMDHVSFLTHETMMGYFAKCGFDVVAIDAAAYHVGYIVRRGSKRHFDNKEHAKQMSEILRAHLVRPEPRPYPVDLLTRVARRVRQAVKR